MRTTKCAWMIAPCLLLLAAGCSTDSEAGSNELGLDACPEGLDLGEACMADAELACFDRESRSVCRCERGDDGRGHLVCDPEHELPPLPEDDEYCRDHVRTGESCEPDVDRSCTHSCDDSVRCHCVPEAEHDGCGHVWLCEDDRPPTPPPGHGCDEELIERCLETGEAECVDPEGRRCWCRSDGSGTAHMECEPIEPPDPGGPSCSEEAWERCLAGEPVECIDGDRYCRCEPRDGGDVEFWCEEPPRPTEPQCTDRDFVLCQEHGEPIECFEGDRPCYCQPMDDGRFDFRCEEPPSTVEPQCTDRDFVLCQEHGEPIECFEGDRPCYCQPLDDGRFDFRCEEPPSTVEPQCTDRDVSLCAERGEPVECFDGRNPCSCQPRDEGRFDLLCEGRSDPVEPPDDGGCTDAELDACHRGEPVECRRGDEVCHCLTEGERDERGERGELVCR